MQSAPPGSHLINTTQRDGFWNHCFFRWVFTSVSNHQLTSSLTVALDLSWTSSLQLLPTLSQSCPLSLRLAHLTTSVLRVILMSILVDQSGAFQKRIWNYEKADVRGLNNALANADWNIVDNSDIDSAMSAWNETFLSIVSKFIPSKIIRTIKKKKPFCKQGHRNSYKREALCSQKTQEKPISGKPGSFQTEKKPCHPPAPEERTRTGHHPPENSNAGHGFINFTLLLEAHEIYSRKVTTDDNSYLGRSR